MPGYVGRQIDVYMFQHEGRLKRKREEQGEIVTITYCVRVTFSRRLTDCSRKNNQTHAK